MKRNDLRAMGMTPDQIDSIMTMNGNDINRERAKAAPPSREVERLRESCTVLLELLEGPERVRDVLRYVSRLYTEQERSKPQEGQE